MPQIEDKTTSEEWEAGKVADKGVTLHIETTHGLQVERQFARMMARLVARYRLAAVPGRPEELIRPGTSQGVSLGYGCQTIRVRTMEGRDWTGYHDFQINDDWHDALIELCDRHFGIEDSDLGVPRPRQPGTPTQPSPLDQIYPDTRK